MSNNYIIPYSGVSRVTPVNADNTVDTSTKVKPVECQTCKNRKYVDGSNEPDVSFKTPGKIAAGESYAKVSAHEREHVANAIQKSSKPGAKLISANVTLKMGVCPECGRSYVSGGTTSTKISYPNEQTNPYARNQKSADAAMLIGSNLDLAV